MSTPIFTMMVGLPGSGKTTYAEKLSRNTGAKVLSSDRIRLELFGDENSQEDNEKVFNTLHSRIKDNLRAGEDVIFDATNINSKRRTHFLKQLKDIPCKKRCVVMATPFALCAEQNEARDRSVPYEVIERMCKNWNTPYWFEGWDEIKLMYSEDSLSMRQTIENWYFNHLYYDQDNPHHEHSLVSHCVLVGEALGKEEDAALRWAGFLHDCGKPVTKGYRNSKGELTEVAHYYQHHCAGAYESLFFIYPKEVSVLDVSILINLHMHPYFWESDKNHEEQNKQKYKRIWGEELYEKVMKLHMADKTSH